MTNIMTEENNRQQRLALLLGAPVVGVGMVLASEQPTFAAPSPEVQALVTNALDTIPLLTGVCMAVFGAGLAPWAARTTLSWLSSIMKGAI